MSSLRLTIYEILGYMAPGVVGLTAISIIFWSAFLPRHAVAIAPRSLSKEELAIFLFTAYAIGHLIQGICNCHPSPEKLAEKKGKHTILVANARIGLARQCSVELGKYDLAQIVSLAQTSLLHTGRTDDHDVFLYREGFYRGSSAGYTLLGVALLFRAFRGDASVVASGTVTPVSQAAIVFISLLSFIISFVFYQRYIRFSTYRMQNLLNFACMPNAASTKSADAAKPEDEKGE